MSGARYAKSFRSPKEATASVAKVYSDVCVQRPKEYSDYEVRWLLETEHSCMAKAQLIVLLMAVIRAVTNFSQCAHVGSLSTVGGPRCI
jgi:hypothetical protein